MGKNKEKLERIKKIAQMQPYDPYQGAGMPMPSMNMWGSMQPPMGGPMDMQQPPMGSPNMPFIGPMDMSMYQQPPMMPYPDMQPPMGNMPPMGGPMDMSMYQQPPMMPYPDMQPPMGNMPPMGGPMDMGGNPQMMGGFNPVGAPMGESPAMVPQPTPIDQAAQPQTTTDRLAELFQYR